MVSPVVVVIISIRGQAALRAAKWRRNRSEKKQERKKEKKKKKKKKAREAATCVHANDSNGWSELLPAAEWQFVLIFKLVARIHSRLADAGAHLSGWRTTGHAAARPTRACGPDIKWRRGPIPWAGGGADSRLSVSPF